jgi:hypothetical protein
MKRIDPYPHLRYAKKRGYLFIHITKTAGTSILDALEIPSRHHADYRVFLAANPVLFASVFKFCFVRNPYARIVSTYLYLRNGGAGPTDKDLCTYIRENSDNFETFVENILDTDLTHTHSLFRPQYAFICDFKYRILVDFVGRFEKLEEDWTYIANKIGAKKSLEKLNAQNIYNYKEVYTEKSANKVYSVYKKDFDTFDYPSDSYK